MLIPALSVRQPYAGLLLAKFDLNSAIKPIENRSWSTHHTGRLAICATKRPESADVFKATRDKCKRLGYVFPEELCALNGVCLGTVDHLGYIWLEQGKPLTDNPEVINPYLPMRRARHWWNPPSIGWVFRDPELIEPFPVKGKLSLFSVDIPSLQ